MADGFYFFLSAESYGTEMSLRHCKELRRLERAAIRNEKEIFRDAVKYQTLTEA